MTTFDHKKCYNINKKPYIDVFNHANSTSYKNVRHFIVTAPGGGGGGVASLLLYTKRIRGTVNDHHVGLTLKFIKSFFKLAYIQINLQ